MKLFGQLKLAFQGKRLLDAVGREKGMDWSKTAKKMAYDFLRTCAGIAVAAVISYYSDPEHLKTALALLPAPVALAAIPLVSATLRGISNWWKVHFPTPWDGEDRRGQ